VLLLGAGPTGLMLTSLLSSGGVGRLTVAARTAAKLGFARARGADEIVITNRDVEQRFRDLAPEGFDIVIDATGARPVLQRSI